MLIAYILFDTRMDIKEAKYLLTSELPPELRVVSLAEIDSDVFMLIRIISMFRGILTSRERCHRSSGIHLLLLFYTEMESIICTLTTLTYRRMQTVFESK